MWTIVSSEHKMPTEMKHDLPNRRFGSARTAPFWRRQTYGLTGRARWLL
ncbi:hypothetical protein Z950_3153 [Sulfitobacter mediterraneus KCTC 32188]|nr:hypothetical protein Z950_3153 [Sulfitobacter mediterraneus KCTC 32188]